jgi:hypothetical protein
MLASMQAILFVFVVLVFAPSLAWAQRGEDPGGDYDPPPRPEPAPGKVLLDGLNTVSAEDWDSAAVRRVLQSFAFGGQAGDSQIAQWAAMDPALAITEMLNFDPVNGKLSPAGAADRSGRLCRSLTDLQTFWSSDDPKNPVRVFDRPYYSLLYENETQLSPVGLFLVWARAMHTRGCNPFVHKMAFYLTNYHASIHIQNAGVALIRDYYDDTVAALAAGYDFVDLMYHAASNGAVAFAYGHWLNYVHPETGEFFGD